MEKRTNINFKAEDIAAIALIRSYYGLDSDADAIRFTLRKEAKDIQRKEKMDKPKNPRLS